MIDENEKRTQRAIFAQIRKLALLTRELAEIIEDHYTSDDELAREYVSHIRHEIEMAFGLQKEKK